MDTEHTYDLDNAFDSLFGAWRGQAIGLLDLDAFFASVEQLDHPEWRGKPVIVGGPPESRGVVSTASYEARMFGVHSAMSSAQAQRLCPHAFWTKGNFARYREMSAQVMAILADETPYVDQVSIDEAFFDVTPGRFNTENPVEICKRISARVSKLGITCSIGLGSSKTVAKIASERDKPHGLTIVIPGTERAFLSPLPVRAMSGIGAAAERMLNDRGIRTLGAIASARQSDLIAVFGVNADLMRERAQGGELSAVSPIDAPEDVKSVSNERTFAHDLIERADIEAAIVLLGESIARRMRRKALLGNTVTLKLKYNWGAGKTIQRRLPHPTDDENVFVPVALSLLSSVWSEGMHVRLAGLAMSDFDSPKEVQTDLFCTLDERGAQTSERRKLSVTIDQVREKFGEGAVGFGRAARFDGDIVRKDKYMHKED